MKLFILLLIFSSLLLGCDDVFDHKTKTYKSCCEGHGTVIYCNSRHHYVCSDGYVSYECYCDP